MTTSRKELAEFCQRLIELINGQSAHRVDNDRRFNGEESVGSYVTSNFQLAARQIPVIQSNRIEIGVGLARDLKQNQIVPRQVGDDKRWTALAWQEIRLGKGQNDDIAHYRFAHASSSSGVFQSRAMTGSLAKRPSKVSVSDLNRKKRAKS
jgi:hypothetical protein